MPCENCRRPNCDGLSDCPAENMAARKLPDMVKSNLVIAQRDADEVPDGVRGWSWGAFLLNWVWAIGNRTWIGLLVLVPYAGLGVAVWLGMQGREMAWKNKHWENLDHFNRVQRAWSVWAVALCTATAVLGVVAAFSLRGI